MPGVGNSIFGESPVVTDWRASYDLHAAYPVLQLALDGTVTSANALALWLWGAIDADGVVQGKSIIGSSIYDIYARNLRRIPVELNHDFLKKASRSAELTAKLFQNDGLKSAFMQAMLASHKTARLYRNMMINGHKRALIRGWDAHLVINHPFSTDNDNLLMLIATTSKTYHGGEHTGYMMSFDPISVDTSDIITFVHSWVIRQHGDKAYVLDQNMTKEKLVAHDTWSLEWGNPTLQALGRWLTMNGLSPARAKSVTEDVWLFYSHGIMPLWGETVPLAILGTHTRAEYLQILLQAPITPLNTKVKTHDVEALKEGLNNRIAKPYNGRPQLQLSAIYIDDIDLFDETVGRDAERSKMDYIGIYRDDLKSDLKRVFHAQEVERWLRLPNELLHGRTGAEVLGTPADAPIRDALFRVRHGMAS